MNCPRCQLPVGYIYDDADELVVVERSENGNLSLEPGGLTAHVVAPGSGAYRVHECSAEREAQAA